MWSTTDEIRFINGLGQHCNPVAVVPYEEKLEFLKRYREGINLRCRWGNIEPETIFEYVENRIAYYRDLIANPNSHIKD
jgi:hypothetical protein